MGVDSNRLGLGEKLEVLSPALFVTAPEELQFTRAAACLFVAQQAAVGRFERGRRPDHMWLQLESG
jgi:hypothetical protein